MTDKLIKKISTLSNNDGMTLKGFTPIIYKSGYQVGITGIETTDIKKAIKAINDYNGNCGVWYSDGVYYIDQSLRVSEKKVAVELAKKCNQLSILKWSDMSLIYTA